MEEKLTSYTADNKLRTLVEDNPLLLGIMSRFGISFGFGDNTVADACRADAIDCPSFLAVCNLICGRGYEAADISLAALMKYLRNAHVHILDYLLPSIRRKLIEAVNASAIDDAAFLLLRFFDDYVTEVNRHMHHEDDRVFSYVDRLLRGEISEDFRITTYSAHHVSMTEKLNRLKDIFIRHYHVKGNEPLTSALIDLIDCGHELDRHCEIENRLFIPAVEKLELSLKLRAVENGVSNTAPDDPHASLLDSMTEREKEILCCVAKGMANKMIADRLCLSIHTVTTHRKNISTKLNIHSSAGLTIFAILNNLIDIHDVNLHI